jgi:hypothetical protein
LVPDDCKYGYRDILRKQFSAWGVEPVARTATGCARGEAAEEGAWERPAQEACLDYERVHRDALISERDEVFRFLWDNRQALRLYENVHTRVLSVRPCTRVATDGFMLHETVAEYLQVLDLEARDLPTVTRAQGGPAIAQPAGMPDDTPVRLWGGGVLIFDEYARLKYHIRSRLDNVDRQSVRLKYLWENGICDSKGRYGARDHGDAEQQFALMHLQRSRRLAKETWSK